MVRLITIPDMVAAIRADTGISAERNHAKFNPVSKRQTLAKLPTREAHSRSLTRETLGIERGRSRNLTERKDAELP